MKTKVAEVKYGDVCQGNTLTLYCENKSEDVQTYIDDTELGLFPTLQDAMQSLRIAWSGWDTYVETMVE